MTGAPVAVYAQQYPLHYHEQSEGLGNLSVTALVQDRDGYLWVGTENGLYRYDGTTFVRWGHASDLMVWDIMALHIDADGHLWVATSTELYLMHGGEAMPVRLNGTSIPAEARENFASDGPGRVLMVSRRRLLALQWTKTGGWTAHPYFSDAQKAEHPELKSVTHIHAGRDGSLWISCGRALCQSRGGRLTVWRTPQAEAQGWSEIHEDSHGGLWLRDANQVLQKPAGATAFVDRTPPWAGPARGLVQTPIAEDAQGRIVISADKGVARWTEGRWEQIGAGNGVTAPGGISTLLVDRDGGMWLGTSGRGLAQWMSYDHLSAWTSKEGLPDDDAWWFARDRQGDLHVGTATGLSRLAAGTRRFVPEARDPAIQPGGGGMALDHAGDLWIGDLSGAVFRMRPATRTPVAVAVAKLPLILQVFTDSTGRTWFCTQQGIFVVDPAAGDKRPRRVDAAINPNPAHGPRTFEGCETSPRDLWFTTETELLHWDGVRFERVPLKDAGGKPWAGTGFDNIACTAATGVWLAGGNNRGLWRVRPAGGAATLEQVAAPQLANVRMMGLHADRRGWLWASSDAGVDVWDGTRWRHFDQENGLVWNDTNQHAIQEDTDGSVWVGTGRGAQHFEHVESIFATPRRGAPLVALERGGHAIDTSSRIELPWARAPLKAGFASPSYESRSADSFLYRLVGLDDAWSASTGPGVTFSTLAPGSYRLEVVTVNPVLRFRSPVVSIAFDIAPPWWRTGPFVAAWVLAAGALAWTLHRTRIRVLTRRQRYLENVVTERTRELESSRQSLRKLGEHNVRLLEDERKRVSRELHDELGQQLAALKMEVSALQLAARATQPGPAGAGQFAPLIQRVDGLVACVRGVVSQLRPPALDGGLVAAIDWLAAEFARGSGVPCALEVDPDVRALDADTATTVFRIAQESLTNVLRHAKARHVELRLVRDSAGWMLTIADNGVGLVPGAILAGHGLLGLEERARLIGGELTIESAAGAGTIVRLRFRAGEAASPR